MLHDILYALLGFTGDIIVSNDDLLTAAEELHLPSLTQSWIEEGKSSEMFHVLKGYPYVSEAEREQINRIVPLGWYYNRFTTYIERYDMTWMKAAPDQEVYKMALVAAIQDFLQDYVQDIRQLEDLLNQEDTLPLSHFLQHVQKVSF